MKCFDEKISLNGNFNTENAQNLVLVFEKCDPSVTTCKSEEVIEEFIRSSYIVTAENTWIFY